MDEAADEILPTHPPTHPPTQPLLSLLPFSAFFRNRATSAGSVGSTSLGHPPSVCRMEVFLRTRRSVLTLCAGWVGGEWVGGWVGGWGPCASINSAQPPSSCSSSSSSSSSFSSTHLVRGHLGGRVDGHGARVVRHVVGWVAAAAAAGRGGGQGKEEGGGPILEVGAGVLPKSRPGLAVGVRHLHIFYGLSVWETR